ncbi:MAG: bifunctional 2-polyprenyl-6-hydroxyphenol methylase/3-demethylubiquinol 3-O-methyltransferase UbiG [Gammaproteobacteria bacterium]
MNNIDPIEIEKFDKLSATWWDTDGESRALHDINQCRGEFVTETPVAGKNILDVGCGGGLLSEYLARAGANVVGLDASEAIIEVARDHAKLNNLSIDYRVSTIEEFASGNVASFDVVTCMEMLEHVPSPAQIIAAISKCLVADGTAYFSTINRTPKAYLHGVLAAEYVLKLLPIGTHDYENFIRPSELLRWCREAKLNAVSSHGIKYNPFSRKASLVKDLGVNYIVKTQRESLDGK